MKTEQQRQKDRETSGWIALFCFLGIALILIGAVVYNLADKLF